MSYGSYDQNLLEAAPVATRAQLQEGYSTDLLDENRVQRSRSTRIPAPPVSTTPRPSLPSVPVLGSQEKFQDTLPSADPSSPITPRRLPFWRTRTGIITLVVLAIVVVGAVVGGAVGGTVGQHHNTAAASSSSSSSGSATAPSSSAATSLAGVASNGNGAPPVASNTPPSSAKETISSTPAAANIQVSQPTAVIGTKQNPSAEDSAFAGPGS